MITYDQANAVNKKVNALPYNTDMAVFGLPEKWEDITERGTGDCEDFAIAKLRDLLAEGASKEQLKLGLCTVETGEYHAVLVVTIEGEDWALDNRYPTPVRWETLPYKWDKFYLFGERKWRAAVGQTFIA